MLVKMLLFSGDLISETRLLKKDGCGREERIFGGMVIYVNVVCVWWRDAEDLRFGVTKCGNGIFGAKGLGLGGESLGV